MNKFVFGENEMKQLIETYYRKYEDFDGVFNSSCSLGLVGQRNCERYDAIVSMNIKGKFTVSGMEVELIRDVNEEDVFNAFRVVLGDAGYTVSSVTFDKGTANVCEGHYMNERMVAKPYFRGVAVEVKEKVFVR